MSTLQDRAASPKVTLPDEDLMAEARKYVRNGVAFLEAHVPGWRERARQACVFEMITADYCALAITCKGVTLNGHVCLSAGDVCRAFPDLRLGNPEFGFYVPTPVTYGKVRGVNYSHLQVAWQEVLGRGVLPSPQ